MLEHLGLPGGSGGEGVELSIALVSDEVIRDLNRSFRRKDKPTDVLAFPMSDAPKADFPRSGLLGDVILSIETARRQAAANSRPLAAELTMLLAHGLLHLLGYDHQTDDEEREMTALTKALEDAATRGAQAEPARSSRPRAPAKEAAKVKTNVKANVKATAKTTVTRAAKTLRPLTKRTK